MLDVLFRSQRGRICVFKRADMEIETPCIVGTDDAEPMYISTDCSRTLSAFGDRVKMDVPLLIPNAYNMSQDVMSQHGVSIIRADITEDKLREDDHLYVIPNGFELRNDFRLLLSRITEIRERIGHNSLLYVSGIAEPSNLALLAYVGIDIFDDALCRAYGKNGIRCIPEGQIVTGNDETENNILELKRECQTVKEFIKAGRLRELVDQRAPSSPFTVAALRTFDGQYFDYQEEACATAGGRFACNTTQSLFRPEVKRFRQRILNEYRKPAHKKVLVLLPCSAKKPYHVSKSHRGFASAVHAGTHDVFVHEVIVTSPLGAVPRELDIFFPANSYDIPVTGQWKCQEKEFIREAMKSIIDQGYDAIISHLGEDTELVRGLADVVETCLGDPVSPASLGKLEDEIRKAAKPYGEGSYSVDRDENVHSVLSYQFGKNTAEKIMKGTHVTGKFPYWKLFRGKVQIGMVTPERQMTSMTMDGAQILAEEGVNIVEMQDFELKGSLFAVGVIKADPSIRVGDEAVITVNGEVRGIGVAQMSGREMTELKRGVAVKVRHKR